MSNSPGQDGSFPSTAGGLKDPRYFFGNYYCLTLVLCGAGCWFRCCVVSDHGIMQRERNEGTNGRTAVASKVAPAATLRQSLLIKKYTRYPTRYMYVLVHFPKAESLSMAIITSSRSAASTEHARYLEPGSR